MRTNRRIFIGLAASASLFTLMSAALAETALNVGAYPTNPPFETKMSNGTFEGFEVDVVNEAAKRAGMTTDIADYGFQALFAAIASKRIDVAISSITITPERLKSVSFTQPYYDSDMGIAAKEDSPIKAVADLKGKIVGYLSGSTGEKWVKDNQAADGFADVKGYKAQQDLLLDLSAGRIDAVVSDIPGMQYAFKTMKGLAVKDRIKTGEQYGLMMGKDDPEPRQVERRLVGDEGDGTLAEIHEKWFGAAPRGGIVNGDGAANSEVTPQVRTASGAVSETTFAADATRVLVFRNRTNPASRDAMSLLQTFFNSNVMLESLPALLRGLRNTLVLSFFSIVYGASSASSMPYPTLCAADPALARDRLYRHLPRDADAGHSHSGLLRVALSRRQLFLLDLGGSCLLPRHGRLLGRGLSRGNRGGSPRTIRGGRRPRPALSSDPAPGDAAAGDAFDHSADDRQLRVDVQGHFSRLDRRASRIAQRGDQLTGPLRKSFAAHPGGDHLRRHLVADGSTGERSQATA